MADHEHRPGWLLRIYANPRGNRMQLGYRQNPVMICRICGKRIVQQNVPSRLLAAGTIFLLCMMTICIWVAYKLGQPLLLLLLIPLFFGIHYTVYKHTTYVLLKYHKRHER